MGRMVQIRNMPEALHRKLKSRAAEAGRSLSDYLLEELRRSAAKPTAEELMRRIEARERVDLSGAMIAGTIREERRKRDDELGKRFSRR
jgi:plasmid stability protein